MTVKFKLGPDGSFTCGDTKSGVTVYSYPSSIHAKAATRDAATAARSILREQPRYRGDAGIVAEYDARNWKTLGGEA